MAKKKKSIFERLTGTINFDSESEMDFDDEEFDEEEMDEEEDNWEDEDDEEPEVDSEEAQLAIDMYQTASQIVIQTMVAGVRPEDLDVSITREVITIKGRREGPRGKECHRRVFFTQRIL